MIIVGEVACGNQDVSRSNDWWFSRAPPSAIIGLAFHHIQFDLIRRAGLVRKLPRIKNQELQLSEVRE